MIEMTTERAIEVLKQYIDFRYGALQMPDGVELDKALSKAIEVMGKDYTELIKEAEALYPYKVVGKFETYDQYNEGWSDACDYIEQLLRGKQ